VLASPVAAYRKLVAAPITMQLWFGFGVLVSVLGLVALLASLQILKIQRSVTLITEIHEPLKEAILEMQIIALETARQTSSYVFDQAPIHLEKLSVLKTDFNLFSATFKILAETDMERRLMKEAASRYTMFLALSNEIVEIARIRKEDLVSFRRITAEIDDLLDTNFRPLVELDSSDPKANEKRKTAGAVHESIDELFPSILTYFAALNLIGRKELEEAEANIKHYEALYRSLGASAEEVSLLDQFDPKFSEAVATGGRIVNLTDQLSVMLEDFERYLGTIDAIVNDQIQPLIHAATEKAALEANTASNRALKIMFWLAILALCIGVMFAWSLSRVVIAPIRRLAGGAEAVGAGDLTHRIEIVSGNEFGRLASAFNDMIESLAQAHRVMENAHDRLADQVAERTWELTQELHARKETEQALAETQIRFRDYAESSSDWFWEMNKDLIIIDVSPGVKTALGLDPIHIIGKLCHELTDEDIRTEKWELHFADLKAHRPFHDFSYKRKMPDSTVRFVSINGKPVFSSDGTFVGYRGTGSDITARIDAGDKLRRHEQELELVQRRVTMGEMAASLAHELNQPLAAIHSYAAGCLRRAGENESLYCEFRETLEDLIHEADRASQIIRNIGIFVRNSEPKKELTDINDIARSIADFTAWQLRGNNIELRLALAAEIPLVPLDRIRVQQVLLNLVGNSIEAMRDSAPLDREIVIETSSPDAGCVEVSVRDNGAGLDEDVARFIFEPFFTTKKNGTGMGLAICKRIVEAHFGQLRASRNSDRGATFSFTIST